METRANFALIGAFTLAVVFAAFAFVFWFSGSGKTAQYRDIRAHRARLGGRFDARKHRAIQRT